MMNVEINKWYVLKILPKKERQTLSHLDELGYTFYYPTYTSYKINNGKKEAVKVPLFTGYVFIRNTFLEVDSKLQFIRGTSGLLTIGVNHAYATNQEIELLKRLSKKIKPPELVNEMVVGEWITIKNGSLKGFSGIVKKILNKHYIHIEIGTTGMILKLKLSENLVERMVKR